MKVRTQSRDRVCLFFLLFLLFPACDFSCFVMAHVTGALPLDLPLTHLIDYEFDQYVGNLDYVMEILKTLFVQLSCVTLWEDDVTKGTGTSSPWW